MAKLEEIKPGLHRWTARVPDWTPDQGGAEGWAQEVACVAWEGYGALVLIDPLVDPGDWREVDALVKHHGEPVAVVTTCPWHARSTEEAVQRYVNSPGVATHAHINAAAERTRMTFEVTHPITGDRADLPGGVQAFLTDEPNGEITVWIEVIATIVAGDVLIGAEAERTQALRVCPQAWLGEAPTVAEVKAALRPLLELEIEVVVPLHGAPVRDGAKEALSRALGDDPALSGKPRSSGREFP